MPDPIDWNIGDIDCSTAKYFYHGSFLGFKYQNDIVWYKQKNSKNIEKIAFLPSGDGIILYSDGKKMVAHRKKSSEITKKSFRRRSFSRDINFIFLRQGFHFCLEFRM